MRPGWYVWIVAVAVLAGCGSRQRRRTPVAAPPANADLGACVAFERAGVVSAAPRLRRSDRDLDGDGVAELVAADDALCDERGNCHWNIFVRGGPGCRRYAGTVSGAGIEVLARGTERGFRALRAWWRFTDHREPARLLLQEYEFRRGGYRLIEAMLCRQGDDDRIRCASEGDTSARGALY